jgi:hypothetical protein
MALGVDSASSLASINWQSFYNWDGSYPTYAGRYFGGSFSWVPGEFIAAMKETGGILNKIVPIQSCITGNEQATGAVGYNLGKTDAINTCLSIVSAINSGQLVIPPSGSVYVYLDVEMGVNLSVDYWAAWSSNIFNYVMNGNCPFWPCIYTWYGAQPNGKFSPGESVQNVLNSVYTTYPDHESLCYGLWSNEPEPNAYIAAKASPSWSVFNPVFQKTPGASKPVPLLLYQFAEKGTNTAFAGGQNLDLDSDNSGITVAQNYMLTIA